MVFIGLTGENISIHTNVVIVQQWFDINHSYRHMQRLIYALTFIINESIYCANTNWKTAMTQALTTLETPIIKEWIDYNGHLNDAYYLVIFTQATDALQNHLNLTLEHIQSTGETLFTVETHLAYVQEIGLGEMVTVTSQLLETDNKRMRIFHRMFNSKGELLATVEMLFLCYNLIAKKVSNFSDLMLSNLAQLQQDQVQLPWPDSAGKGIALKRT